MGLAGRSEAGRERKASELSQAEGHQGAALEFLQHSWAAADMVFPDPAGPYLLGINMPPFTPTLEGEGRFCEEVDSLGVATLWGNSRPQFPHLENGFGLDDSTQAAATPGLAQGTAPSTPPPHTKGASRFLTLAAGSPSVKWAG